MPRFFNILKKKTVLDPFLVHFPNFGGKKNPALSHTTSYGLLASYQNLEKTNDSIPSKHSDRWKERRTDGRVDKPYFIGSFQLMLGGPNKKRNKKIKANTCFHVIPLPLPRYRALSTNINGNHDHVSR